MCLLCDCSRASWARLELGFFWADVLLGVADDAPGQARCAVHSVVCEPASLVVCKIFFPWPRAVCLHNSQGVFAAFEEASVDMTIASVAMCFLAVLIYALVDFFDDVSVGNYAE